MSKLLLLVAWFAQILLSPYPVTAQGSPPCQFPFIYNKIVHSACTTVDDPDGKLWCSTRTDNNNVHVQGNYRECTANDVPRAPEIKTPTGCTTYPDKRPGDCISIRQCPALNPLLQQARGSATAADTLRKSVCANDGSVRVCCPRANTNSVTQQPQRPTPTPTAQPTRRPINVECGQPASFQFIVGGEDASFGSWPWMVIFRGREKQRCSDSNPSCSGWAAQGFCQRHSTFMDVNCRKSCNKCPSATGPSNWFCGGVIITDQYVLTAAHCFANTEIEYARIGEFDLKKNPDTGHRRTAPLPQDIDVERVIIHPMYKVSCERCNDIALVKLARPATLDPIFVKPICLPSNPERDMGFSVKGFQKQLGWATGWGVTDAANIHATLRPGILQQVNLTIQERPYCTQQKRNYPNDRMILCAGQGDGRDVCRADSGGPLMLSDQFAMKWYVVGITSFGATICGDPRAQGIFTSVHHYMNWIHSHIL